MKRVAFILAAALATRAQPAERPRILGIAHVAVRVPDAPSNMSISVTVV